MTQPPATVFLIDVDNTLLDNDRVIADLHTHLEENFGAESSARYWDALEALRTELGYVDYLGALQRYRAEESRRGMSDSRLLLMSGFLIDYPFADRLYPGALIYVHKEEMLDAVAQSHPAGHYVMIDDKLRILSAMKAVWGPRLTTVFVRQGHYALDAQAIAAYAPADITIERIGDLINFDFPST